MKKCFLIFLMFAAISSSAQESLVSLCPDGNHPHAIDLGLSVKWSCCNVGAINPKEYGGYYQMPNSNIAHDIAGSKYDPARSMGEDWFMPTEDQLKELVQKCTHQFVMIGHVQGSLFTAANGNRIFLPGGGMDGDRGSNSGFYWASTFPETCLYDDMIYRLPDRRLKYKLSVRPVFRSPNGIENSKDDFFKPEIDPSSEIELLPDVIASFPGGQRMYERYLRNNLKLPQKSSRVIVHFVVEKDGSLSDIRIIRSDNPDFNSEVLRFIKAMPKWIPATKYGKIVRSEMNFPISFVFQ